MAYYTQLQLDAQRQYKIQQRATIAASRLLGILEIDEFDLNPGLMDEIATALEGIHLELQDASTFEGFTDYGIADWPTDDNGGPE